MTQNNAHQWSKTFERAGCKKLRKKKYSIYIFCCALRPCRVPCRRKLMSCPRTPGTNSYQNKEVAGTPPPLPRSLTKVVFGRLGVLIIVRYLQSAKKKNYANITSFLIDFLIEKTASKKNIYLLRPLSRNPSLMRQTYLELKRLMSNSEKGRIV